MEFAKLVWELESKLRKRAKAPKEIIYKLKEVA
jgi:hypothetical protein